MPLNYYIRHQGMVAMHRRGEGDIWQGLWEPYMEETPQHIIPTEDPVLVKKNVKHVLTHRILWADLYLWEPVSRPSLPPDYIWIPEADIDQYALPRLVEILIESISLP